MHYAPRTIGFHCELIHPPTPLEPARLQRLHDQMFRERPSLYSNFNVGAEGITLSNPLPANGAVSSLSFQLDRIQLREEQTGVSEDEFAQRVRALAAPMLAARGVQALVAQQITVRTLVNLRHFNDSRQFLRQAMFRFREELGAFEREPQLLGLRLAFPMTDQSPNVFLLRIESFHQDPRSLFIECQGTFAPLVVAQAASELAERIAATYRFAAERSIRFVAAFDARQKA